MLNNETVSVGKRTYVSLCDHYLYVAKYERKQP